MLVELGVITRPQGVRGEVRVHPFNPDSDLLAKLEEVVLVDESGTTRTMKVRASRRAPKAFLMSFEGIATRDDADGRIAGRYRKMHIPDDPLYYEKFYFTPGDTGFCSFPTRYGRLGVCVCWDQWFPEAARLTA